MTLWDEPSSLQGVPRYDVGLLVYVHQRCLADTFLFSGDCFDEVNLGCAELYCTLDFCTGELHVSMVGFGPEPLDLAHRELLALMSSAYFFLVEADKHHEILATELPRRADIRSILHRRQ